jgi:hypothetical protein
MHEARCFSQELAAQGEHFGSVEEGAAPFESLDSFEGFFGVQQRQSVEHSLAVGRDGLGIMALGRTHDHRYPHGAIDQDKVAGQGPE